MSLSKKIIYVLGSLCLVVGIYVFFPSVGNRVATFVKSAQDFATTKNIVQEVGKELFSTPLRKDNGELQGELSFSGVITNTNLERKKEGLQPLSYNAELTLAAQKKLDDMFAQQYFEHISPQGHGPGHLAEQADYRYIIVGENLALGNFADDADLVAAWMASPGHRANIMHTRFTEIGVAVGQGMFQGKKTWLAVQEFGTPASSCPSINTALKQRIDRDKTRSSQMSKDIEAMHSEIRSMPRETEEEQREYNKKIDEYNALVVEYEALLEHLENSIDEYNRLVRVYNKCVEGV